MFLCVVIGRAVFAFIFVIDMSPNSSREPLPC